jgi:hypothetical protein
MGDEERFGVVARPDGASSKSYIRADRIIDPVLGASFVASAALNGIAAVPGPWAKEYTRIISTGAVTPSKLVDIREGDVYDDYGNAITLSTSGKPLRLKAEYFTEGLLGGAFFVGVDQDGNFSVAAPDEASVGGVVTIPGGDLLLSLGANYTTQVQRDCILATAEGSVTIDAQAGYTLTTNGGPITMRPSTTFDVGGADEPATLGQQLLDFLGVLLDLLTQHTHVGNLGAPTPLDPAILAQLTQIKTQYVDGRALVSDFINLSKVP